MSTVIVIVGPTASGKTSLSVKLAREINGEIISADSMQVYKYMDIGTAKPDNVEKDNIKHYLMDEVDPNEEFNVAKYQKLALNYIDEVLENSKIPIVVGGTGLYINSLLYNINFSETQTDWDFRENLKKEAEEKGNEFLHNKLKEVDIIAAQKINVNDIKRIIRALEVYNYTNKTISEHQEVSLAIPSKYKFIVFGLNMNREALYERINKRVDIMFEKGLINEVKRLRGMGYDIKTIAMQGIGYKEILSYLRGNLTLSEAVEIIKRESRRYAKRQLTWFRRNKEIIWLDLEIRDEDEILKLMKYHIARQGIFL